MFFGTVSKYSISDSKLYAELSKQLCDVKIRCEDKTYECHEVILSMRSPVFKTMFASEMSEKKSGQMTIENFSPEAVAEMLTFIYTGSCNITEYSEMAEELFRIADMYNIQSLRNLCMDTLLFNMDVNNCIRLLGMGDLYKDVHLKSMALEMVVENRGELVNSVNWQLR